MNKFFSKEVIKTDTLTSGLKDTQYLLIGGGNLIMDLYPESPDLIHKICDIAEKGKIKYSFVGVGAGPLNTLHGKKVFENILKHAEFIFLRDQQSLVLAQEIYPKIILDLMPDLALGLDIDHKCQMNQNTFLINVASVYGRGWPVEDESKFKKYIQNLAEVTNELIRFIDFDKVLLFYSNYPLDQVGGNAYAEELKKYNIDIEIIDKKLSVSEIISLGRDAKLTLVTRLHAGIMAYHGGSSIAAVSYQPKVQDVLVESGITDCIFDIDFKNKEAVIPQIVEFVKHKSSSPNKKAMSKIDGVIAKVLPMGSR